MKRTGHSRSYQASSTATTALRHSRRLPVGAIVAIPVFVVVTAVSAAAADSLSAGVARADITPDPQMINWVTQEPYDGVLDPLYAQALVLGSGDRRVVILTLDLIQVRESTAARLRDEIHQAIGVPGDRVLINASHTHSAPRPPYYQTHDDGRGGADERYDDDPYYAAWRDRFAQWCLGIVEEADGNRQPVTLAIGRADAGEWFFNRRPVEPDGTVRTIFTPDDPHVLPDGLRFGPIDPTLTTLSLRLEDGDHLATLFHAACHAVSVYPHHDGISADWPGYARQQTEKRLGGEALFLAGCGGDIVPARRGVDEAREMGALLGKRAEAAAGIDHALAGTPLHASRAIVGLPLTARAAEDMGRSTLDAEVQVITLGDLAIVALPGEPLIGLSKAIQADSPFPHTLVLGYSNGRGAHYVGMPGEKARGGYEMGGAGRATDEAGGFMVATALRLLETHRDRQEQDEQAAEQP